MTRCAEFYEKWEQDPNWCSKCRTSVWNIDNFITLCKEYPMFTKVNISETALRPLFEKRFNAVRASAISSILGHLQAGEHLTLRDVRRIILTLNHNNMVAARQVSSDICSPILKCGDFRDLAKTIPDNTIDCILTDPPYTTKDVPLLPDFAAMAARVLKPSGFLIFYYGWQFLPELFSSMTRFIPYYWTIPVVMHNGPNSRVHHRHIFQVCKPIFVFQKEPIKPQDRYIPDLLENPHPDKDLHEWGQGIGPLMTLLEYFTFEGDTVLDPMAGGGSTVEACIKTNRKAIAFEINAETYSLLTKRFGGAEHGQVPSEQHT